MVTNEFKKHVGQVVNGNASNTNPNASAQGNVINLSIGATPKEPVKTITSFQYDEITDRVRVVMEKLGKTTADNGHLVFYRKIFNHFGINETLELPADRYKEALALIDSFVDEDKKLGRKNVKPETKFIADKPPARPPTMQIVTCAKCEAKDQRINAMRLVNRVLLALLLGSIGILAWAIMQKPITTEAATQSLQSEPCLFNGISHSAGSKIKMADNQLHECNTKGVWQKLSANKDRPAPKRTRNDDEF